MYRVGFLARISLYVAFVFGTAFALPRESAAADLSEESQIPESLRLMIVGSATYEDGAHFVATVRMALDVAPGARQPILSLAQSVRPDAMLPLQALSAQEEASEPQVAEPESVGTAGPGEPDTLQTAQTADAAKRIQFFSTDGLTGKVELGGSLNTGNTEAEALFAGIDVGRKHGAWSYSVEGEFDFKRSSGTTSKNRFIAEGQVNYDLSDRAYAFATTKYEDDEFSGFSYRVTPSVGMGYEFFVSKRFNWSAEAGPGIRIDKDDATKEVETIPVWRLASAMLWTLTDTASLENDIEVIGDGGLLIDSTTALNTQITEQLSGRVSYQIRSNTDAPAGREETDTTTKASLVYGF